jgi:hypothetical protein
MLNKFEIIAGTMDEDSVDEKLSGLVDQNVISKNINFSDKISIYKLNGYFIESSDNETNEKRIEEFKETMLGIREKLTSVVIIKGKEKIVIIESSIEKET